MDIFLWLSCPCRTISFQGWRYDWQVNDTFTKDDGNISIFCFKKFIPSILWSLLCWQQETPYAMSIFFYIHINVPIFNKLKIILLIVERIDTVSKFAFFFAIFSFAYYSIGITLKCTLEIHSCHLVYQMIRFENWGIKNISKKWTKNKFLFALVRFSGNDDNNRIKSATYTYAPRWAENSYSRQFRFLLS